MQINADSTRKASDPASPVLIIGILVLVFAFFSPTLKNGFVWDDEYNLLNNSYYRGLSWDHLAWMFTTIHDANYHPLCWLSLGVDFSLWGLHPAGYHLTDLILHGLNAVLLFRLIVDLLVHRSTAPGQESLAIHGGAALGALFFALHPLRVESVAWISTRGDTLCGFFYLLTLLCYLRIDDRGRPLLQNEWLWLSLFFFACSLLSRAWGITLPAVLLILDIYPLQKVRLQAVWKRNGRRILMEKLPFALLALIGAILALLAKQGSMVPVARHGLVERGLQSFYGLGFYLWKTLVPLDLSPLYPLHAFDAADPKYALCLLIVVGLTGLLIVFRKRWPWALAAWTCYAVIISPQLGLVQSGPQLVADRYTYFAGMPFAVLVAAAGRRCGAVRRGDRMAQGRRLITVLLAAALLATLGGLSFKQVGIWRNNLSFWNHIIRLDQQNFIAVNERARLKFDEFGDYTGAEIDYSHALELNPEYVDALVNRGLVRLRLKKYKEAAADFRAARDLETGRADVYNGLGLLSFEQHQPEAALAHFDKAVVLNPDFADAYNNRGLLHRAEGRMTAALADFNTAIRLKPEYPSAYVNRGVAYQMQHRYDHAALDFEAALERAPENWTYRQQVARQLRQVHNLQAQAGRH